MGKDSEPLRSGKGRALNVKVAQTCLALHVSHQFTHFAATDGGKDHEDKRAEDGKYVPNPRVAYGVFEGPTRFGRRAPGETLHSGAHLYMPAKQAFSNQASGRSPPPLPLHKKSWTQTRLRIDRFSGYGWSQYYGVVQYQYKSTD